MLKDKTIILGVTACANAYTSAEIAAKLIEQHANVEIIMTENATNLISPLTLRNITRNPVVWDTFGTPASSEVRESTTEEESSFILIAPASANILGKVANGIADNLLTTTIMSADCPIAFVPQMSLKMLEKPIIKHNIEKLKKYGFLFVESQSEQMAQTENIIQFVIEHCK